MNFAQLRQMVAASSNIVFFGGAGVSTESSIPDFRSENGLYQTKFQAGAYPPERILSRSFFMEHTDDFFDFYRTKMIHEDARPNKAHLALAELERQGRLQAVITQNIDGLHQLGGSHNVLELHGSVHRNACMDCGTSYGLADVAGSREAVPRCSRCGGIIKPDVVLYEESLDMELLFRARDYVRSADVLIVGGTSLTVNPAAGLVAEYPGDKLILINRTPTPFDGRADYLINDSIGRVLEALVPESA
ncbi:NAD-dependent deacetylase [Paenibacillus sp. UNCCL117]|uniref:NAD-dependent protein deacylase n=1 Tax=unclassified Paenibacillus TaxID=185978 RepID=UPI0008852DAF|nr:MULTISPECIES: NAD-dependent protein deacylase [unclassified Paenibacillus]SDE46559.1 NAD-dependent deacetylase [Paenibacillus sp. cl123]SFW65833.1 NAD-dependent deacetylase [Paenibacillus sp. UNCCL117]